MFPISYSLIDIWKDDENLECTPLSRCIAFPFLFITMPIAIAFDILTFPFCIPITFIKDACNIKYDKNNLYDIIIRQDPELSQEPIYILSHYDDSSDFPRFRYLP